MEVVPTNDGDDDDGVVWFRCPLCQGFLPKLKDASDETAPEEPVPPHSEETPNNPDVPEPDSGEEENLRWDSPAAMMKDLDKAANPEQADDDVLVGVAIDFDGEPEILDAVEEVVQSIPSESPTKNKEDAEPILEYAALLAETDISQVSPYRPWETYEVGQCINHLAWNDCGVVVSKEDLPGGRKIIKCYFEEAGVVRLIEQAPR